MLETESKPILEDSSNIEVQIRRISVFVEEIVAYCLLTGVVTRDQRLPQIQKQLSYEILRQQSYPRFKLLKKKKKKKKKEKEKITSIKVWFNLTANNISFQCRVFRIATGLFFTRWFYNLSVSQNTYHQFNTIFTPDMFFIYVEQKNDLKNIPKDIIVGWLVRQISKYFLQ